MYFWSSDGDDEEREVERGNIYRDRQLVIPPNYYNLLIGTCENGEH